jgi:murein DD-endopeptidase MepM/ murein hydrolase activator NlpD
LVRSPAGLITLCGLSLAGCSADVARFDLGNPESSASSQQGYGSNRTASNEYGSAGYERPSSSYGSGVARSSLPPAQQPVTTSAIPPQQPVYGGNGYGTYNYGNTSPNSAPARSYQAAPRQQVAPMASRDLPKGDAIEVQPGDTLYSLSRRYGVSLSEMMAVNGLSSPNLKPGQRLHLPAGSSAHAPQRERTYTAPATAAAEPPAPSAEAPSDWNRSYTVRQGESVYSIARQNGVKATDLQRYNGISDVRSLKPGTVLRVPGGSDRAGSGAVADAAPQRSAAPLADAPRTPATTPGVVTLGGGMPSPPPTSSSQQPTLLNGSGSAPDERVARADTPNTASDAVAPSGESVAGSSKLRWPVAGKIISSFGPRNDGTHNDGVNLAAPMGTDVHAAESGVVAYAGDELKGYGNLVLVRHDNGWVTAYAHADEILVKRGDRIKRGQVIAKAGRTGQVDQPQVHFELRQGQKPVDPTPFMEAM